MEKMLLAQNHPLWGSGPGRAVACFVFRRLPYQKNPANRGDCGRGTLTWQLDCHPSNVRLPRQQRFFG
jgi:hypothetical protein